MKKYSKFQKLSLIIICTLVAVITYFGAFEYKKSNLTKWQQEQTIDISKNSGSTKFQAMIDSLSWAGLSFCVTAIAIISVNKYRSSR